MPNTNDFFTFFYSNSLTRLISSLIYVYCLERHGYLLSKEVPQLQFYYIPGGTFLKESLFLYL